MKKCPMFLWYTVCTALLVVFLLLKMYYHQVLRDVISSTYTYPLLARIYVYLGNPGLRFAPGGIIGGHLASRTSLPKWVKRLWPVGLVLSLVYVLAAIAGIFVQSIGAFVNALCTSPYFGWLFLALGLLTGLGYGAGSRER